MNASTQARALLFALFCMTSAACTHTVEGTGPRPDEASLAAVPLPAAGEACECASSSASCCEGDLVCGGPDATPVVCGPTGCSFKGICVSK
jgi:hypothetical protein